MADTRPIFYGSFRESNPLFLTVVREIPGDTGLEVDVYSDPATMLATLENAFEISFNDVDDDLGSASFKIMRSDPKAALCVPGNMIKIKLNGRYVPGGAFFIKPREETELAVNPEDEVIIVSGPSAMAVLDRAQWWYKSAIEPNIETTLARHWSSLASNVNEGDSVLPVTAPYGSRFAIGARLTIGVDEDTEEVRTITLVTPTAITLEEPLGSSHFAGEEIVQEDYPAGTTWVTVADGSGLAVGDYISFDDEFVKIKQVVVTTGTVLQITPTSELHAGAGDDPAAVIKGNAPFGGNWRWEGEPKAEVLRRFVDEAQARDPRLLSHLTYDFTSTHDSNGEAWDDAVSMRYRIGMKGVATWRQLASQGLETEMRHDLLLQAFRTKGVHRDGTTGLDPVVFEPGTHMLEKVRPERPDSLATHVVVEGLNDKYFEISNDALANDPKIGRREDHISVSSEDPTTLQRAGEAYLELLANEQDAVEIPVFHGPRSENQFEPYVDYNKGDWIGVRDDTASAPVSYRIKGIFVGQERDTARYGVVLQLNSIAAEWEIRLQRQLDSLSATGSGGSGGGASSVGLGSSSTRTGGGDHTKLTNLAADSHPQYQLRSERGKANGYAPLSSGLLVPVGYLGIGAAGDGSRVLADDGTWKLGGTGGAAVPAPVQSASGPMTNQSSIPINLPNATTHPRLMAYACEGGQTVTNVTETGAVWTRLWGGSISGYRHELWLGTGNGNGSITVHMSGSQWSHAAVVEILGLTGTLVDTYTASGYAPEIKPVLGKVWIAQCRNGGGGGPSSSINSPAGAHLFPIIQDRNGAVWAMLEPVHSARVVVMPGAGNGQRSVAIWVVD